MLLLQDEVGQNPENRLQVMKKGVLEGPIRNAGFEDLMGDKRQSA